MNARRMARLVLIAALALVGASHVRAAALPTNSPRSTLDALIVSPSGPYTSIAAALQAAGDGDRIEVRGGVYPGPLEVSKPVRLEGVGWPVIDGGGAGTVVTLAAPGAEIRGFEVRNSGAEPDRNHAGITLTAPHTVVEGNRLREVLFGVFVAQADGAVVRKNDIESKADLGQARRGDGVRVWYSAQVTVEGNRVHGARDVVIWYSSGLILRDNLIESGRYGVHLMYCNDALVEGNRLLGNSVGAYVMYSNRVLLRQNLIRGQHGPNGYALGFKDADNVTVTGNALVDNHAGAYLDGTPFTPQGYGRFEGNVIAFNDIGMVLLPAVQGNTFSGNTFWENAEAVAVQGGGELAANDWSGNYWSDYTGFDADGDGQGDLPYRAERLFESLMDREPRLRVLLYSPAVQAIELAALTFPLVRPVPRFTDPAPRVAPLPVPAIAVQPARGSGGMPLAALGVLGLAAGCLWLARGGSTMKRKRPTRAPQPVEITPQGAPAPARELRALNVSKRFGKVQALEGVSFEARPGEVVALWGANGAGKTTLLKATLGLLDFEGQIVVGGCDVLREGKRARRQIGYVPQDLALYDLSVQATLAFFARLKRVDPARIPVLLEQLGLAGHAGKAVPTLSGGLRQRLALAVALLADPPVLLLDEPTANLDTQAQRDYLTLLADLRRREQKTIVFASHRLEEVEALASRVLVLESGRLVSSCSPLDLLETLVPEVQLTLRVPEAQRPAALACLQGQGLSAQLNGRGTVIVRVRTSQKMQPMHALSADGIRVLDFALERGT